MRFGNNGQKENITKISKSKIKETNKDGRREEKYQNYQLLKSNVQL